MGSGWRPAAAVYLNVRAHKVRIDVKMNIQVVTIFADKDGCAASSHRKTEHVSVESANKRHRARRVSRTMADGALGDIEEGAPGTDQIG